MTAAMDTPMEYAGAPDGGGPLVVCRDLFKIYKRADLEVVALRGLDLTVETGELLAVVGSTARVKSRYTRTTFSTTCRATS